MTLGTWLEEAPHETIRDPTTIVVTEVVDINDEIQAFLAECLIEHRLSLTVAKDMAQVLGWARVQARLTPKLIQVQHGDFGEMLAAEVLKHFSGVLIPVRKVRHQIHANQTQVGVDIVALALSSKLDSLHFAEVKYRASSDTSCASEAHEQLIAWHRDEFSQIITFIAQQLYESDLSLYQSLFEYLTDRAERLDQFHIIIVTDPAVWSDTTITNVPDPPDRLEPLTIRSVLINELSALTDHCYEAMKAAVES